jgi:hypothetical protein
MGNVNEPVNERGPSAAELPRDNHENNAVDPVVPVVGTHLEVLNPADFPTFQEPGQRWRTSLIFIYTGIY